MVSFTTVFHPSDFSKGDEGAFTHALRIALANKAELCLLHVDEPTNATHWYDFPSVRATLQSWGISDVSYEAIAKLGLRIKKIQAASEDKSQAIIQYIHDHRPSLVVLATHQRKGLDRWLHHARAEPIARAAHVLTLFVPRRVMGFVSHAGSVQLRNVVIPVDKSPSPQRAINAAVALAESLHCAEVHFHLLYVGGEEAMPEVNFPTRPGWTMERSSWAGEVVDHILNVSETRDADLIVMATRGHHGFLDAWRGSTTERVLREAKCPLLAVPAE